MLNTIWTVIQVVIFGLLAFFGASVLGRQFHYARSGDTISSRASARNTLLSLATAVVVGLAHYVPRATQAAGWGIAFFAISILLLIASTIWFLLYATRIREFISFAILAVAIIFAANSSAKVMSLAWSSQPLTLIFGVGTWILFALAIGLAAIMLAVRLYVLTHRIIWGVIAVILVILTIISLIVIPVNGRQIAGLPTGASTASKNSGAPASSSVSNDFWCTFYNDECQKNDTKDDDLNFGLNPYKKGMSAQDLAKKHREVMLTDPANGTAAMCWLDKHVGTRYMGDKFYDEYDADDVAINAAKETYVQNESLYKKTMTVFLAYMDMATVEVREVEGTLEDQMYQIPGRMSYRGIPDVAVFKSGEQGGHYLVYIFTIKNKVVEVPFRVECLFQPTNVTKYLKVTVSDKPDTSSGSTTSSSSSKSNKSTTTPSPSPSPSPTSPSPSPSPTTPTPTNPYNKDPSKSDNSGRNDDSGPGPDTNNGVGAQYSSKDKGSNSDHKTSSEYDKAIKELEEINGNQKTASDGSAPSYNGGGTTDNNGAAANKPSADKPKESAVSGDSNGQQWDGPDI